jgi:hypothetical protein
MQATAELRKLSELTEEERARAQKFPLRFGIATITLLEGDFEFTGKSSPQLFGKKLLEIRRQDKSFLEKLSRGGETVMQVSPEIVLVDFVAQRLVIQ